MTKIELGGAKPNPVNVLAHNILPGTFFFATYSDLTLGLFLRVWNGVILFNTISGAVKGWYDLIPMGSKCSEYLCVRFNGIK